MARSLPSWLRPDPADYGRRPTGPGGFVTIRSIDVDGTKRRRRVTIAMVADPLASPAGAFPASVAA